MQFNRYSHLFYEASLKFQKLSATLSFSNFKQSFIRVLSCWNINSKNSERQSKQILIFKIELLTLIVILSASSKSFIPGSSVFCLPSPIQNINKAPSICHTSISFSKPNNKITPLSPSPPPKKTLFKKKKTKSLQHLKQK